MVMYIEHCVPLCLIKSILIVSDIATSSGVNKWTVQLNTSSGTNWSSYSGTKTGWKGM